MVFYFVMGMSIVSLTLSENICDREVISEYDLKSNFTILSTSSETISNLRENCLKEIQILDSVMARFYVPSAVFGYNKYYQYGGLSGVTNARAYDGMRLHPGSCSSVRNSNMAVQIKTGITQVTNGSSVCLEIMPEIEHRSLGGHKPGGMIHIVVEVIRRRCDRNSTNSISDIDTNDCQTLSSNNPQLTTSPGTSFPTTSAETRNTSDKPTTTDATASSHTPDNKPVTDHQATFTKPTDAMIPATTTLADLTSTAVHVSVHFSATTKHFLPSTPPVPRLPTSDLNQITSTDKSFSKSTSTFSWNLDSTSTNTVDHTSTQSSSMKDNDNGSIFNLLEGLYVAAGCVIVLLILVLVMCFVRRRRTRCFTPTSLTSGSSGTQSQGIPWRDNWLVRYGANSHNESFDYPESDFYCIHGKFHNCDLHRIHIQDFEREDTEGRGMDANHYDDPWPLVRLDSDFVKNTKNLDYSSDNDTKERDNKRSETNTEVGEESQGNVNTNADNKAAETLTNMINTKYVARLRSASSEGNDVIYDADSKSDIYVSRQRLGDYNGKSGGQRSTSSVCSDTSMTFDDIVRSSIGTIERAHEVSQGVSKTDESMKSRKGWKVSALYAVVSNTAQPEAGNVVQRVSSRRRTLPRRKSSSKSIKSTKSTISHCDVRFPYLASQNDCVVKTSTAINKVCNTSFNIGNADDVDRDRHIPVPNASKCEATHDKPINNVAISEPYKIRGFASGTVQFGK